MPIIISIVAVILVFGIIVIVHEWGHMMAARLCGIAVPDFALGMGPSLLSFQRGETRYHICAFPIGGFVRIAGLEGDEALDGRSFPVSATWRSKNGWQKAFVLIAGPLMNFLLAFVVIMITGFIGFPRDAVVLGEVEPGLAGAEAGLQNGDIVLAIEGNPISSVADFTDNVRSHENEQITLEILRGTHKMNILATPRAEKEYNNGLVSLGVRIGPTPFTNNEIALVLPKSEASKVDFRRGDLITEVNGQPVTNGWDVFGFLADFDPETLEAVNTEGREPVVFTIQRGTEEKQISVPGNTTLISLGLQFRPELQKLPPAESISRSLSDAGAIFIGTLMMFKMTFTSGEVARSISGPVGIVSLIGQSAQSGIYLFLQIVITINISIGLLNLMPFPALDGGRLVFVALNGIGLRISEKREALVHTVGMLMLISLILFITFFDVRSLWFAK